MLLCLKPFYVLIYVKNSYTVWLWSHNDLNLRKPAYIKAYHKLSIENSSKKWITLLSLSTQTVSPIITWQNEWQVTIENN